MYLLHYFIFKIIIPLEIETLTLSQVFRVTNVEF